jgi:regulator of sirC expression with transglutaminase-like and TPR domain
MADEVLGELEASELVVRHQTVDDAGLLEHHEVAVHAALRQVRAHRQHLGDRERSRRRHEHVDDGLAVRGQTMLHPSQPRGDHLAKIVGHDASVPSRRMDPTEAFLRVVRQPDDAIPLDRAALLIAAHDHELDVDAVLARLDDLADGAPDDVAALARHLFVDVGFRGDEHDYADPRNSYLDLVLTRRLGLPITLSLVLLEVGRRRGLHLEGIGMPGHFLVGTGDGVYVDPFHRGAVLDADGCRALFTELRPGAPWHQGYLAPVGARQILVRMLANLVHSLVDRSPADAVWALQLRLAVPGVSADERRDAAALLGTLGRFGEAASALDDLADELDAAGAARARGDAQRLRARAN